jgi:hypothetical protein
MLAIGVPGILPLSLNACADRASIAGPMRITPCPG